MVDFVTHASFLDNSVTTWLYALVGALIGWLVVSWALRIGTQRVEAHAEHIATPRHRNSLRTLLVLLRSTRRWLVFLLTLTLAFETLELPGHTNAILSHVAFVVLGVQIALWCTALIRLWLEERAISDGRNVNRVLVGMLSWGLQLAIWAIVLLAFLANFGIDITAFIASLGVGGIAIALGLQTVLKDVFASIAIGLDKPYEVGEFIMFGDILGTVVKVGARSVRIASLSGEELSISNSNLLGQLVHNFSRMPQRRIVFGFRVPYSTSRVQIETIVEKTRGFLEDEEQVRFDRGHFIAFGEYGFDFEFVYYVLTSNYTTYRDIQQRVNLQIVALLEELNASFAIPSRQVVRTAAVDAGLRGLEGPEAMALPATAATGTVPRGN